MSIQASAHHLEKKEPRDTAPFQYTGVKRTFLGNAPQVIVRERLPGDTEPIHEELPELTSSTATRLMLSMMEPFRKREGVDYEDPEYYETLAWSTIAHEEFVQAHRTLTYFWQNFSDDRKAVEAARDFIRECALNNYYATYG